MGEFVVGLSATRFFTFLSEYLQTSRSETQGSRYVWSAIQQAAESAYEKYPKTLEFDVELLRSRGSKLSQNQRRCILFRMGEKRVLVFYIDAAKAMAEFLGANESFTAEGILQEAEVHFQSLWSKVRPSFREA